MFANTSGRSLQNKWKALPIPKKKKKKWYYTVMAKCLQLNIKKTPLYSHFSDKDQES